MTDTNSFIHNVRLDNNFTITCNRTPEAPNLSWAAKGLLWYVLSRPPGWKIRTWNLSNIYTGDKKKGNGRDSIRGMLVELKKAKYVVYKKSKDEKGQWVHRYDVYPMPFDEYQKMFPEPDNAGLGDLKLANPPILVSKELSSTESLTSSSRRGQGPQKADQPAAPPPEIKRMKERLDKMQPVLKLGPVSIEDILHDYRLYEVLFAIEECNAKSSPKRPNSPGGAFMNCLFSTKKLFDRKRGSDTLEKYLKTCGYTKVLEDNCEIWVE